MASKEEIKKIIDNMTPFQELIMLGASRMVGRTLDQLEAAYDPGTKLEKVKQLVEDILYDYRDVMLRATAELDIKEKSN